MPFLKIFKIFLLFFALNCIGAPANRYLYSLNRHCDLQFTPTNELLSQVVTDYAKKVNAELMAIFPENPRSSNRKTRRNFKIVFNDKIENNIKVIQQNRNITIFIGGISANFQNDYTFLHNFFTALALQAMPYENENVRTQWKLPHWIFLGIHSQIKNTFSGSKILRSQTNMPGLKIFLENNFFPDLLILEQCNGKTMSNIELFFIQDYCRMIMYLSKMLSPDKKNVIGSYLRELYLNQNSSDPAVFQRTVVNFLLKHAKIHLQRMYDIPELYNEKQQLEIFFKFHAPRLTYSFSNHASSKYIHIRFNEFKKIRFAELDEKNIPTGKIIEGSIADLPQLIKKYPYVKNIINLKRGELLFLRHISSNIFLQECNDLSELLRNINDSFFFSPSSYTLKKKLAAMEKKINDFEKIELLLEKHETENLSPFQIFPHEFFIEKEHRNATVPARFNSDLEKIEQSYLK